VLVPLSKSPVLVGGASLKGSATKTSKCSAHLNSCLSQPAQQIRVEKKLFQKSSAPLKALAVVVLCNRLPTTTEQKQANLQMNSQTNIKPYFKATHARKAFTPENKT
jgi:hypothetical protein